MDTQLVVLAVGVTLGLSLLLGLLRVHRRRGSVAASVAGVTTLEEPYPGYFRRHGRTAVASSTSSATADGCRGLSAQDLGAHGVVVVDSVVEGI